MANCTKVMARLVAATMAMNPTVVPEFMMLRMVAPEITSNSTPHR